MGQQIRLSDCNRSAESLKDTELDCDLYIGANVQEEVGLRGAKASTHMIDPDIALL